MEAKRNKPICRIVAGLLLFLAITFLPKYTFAAENGTSADAGGATGFTYKINFPENQMEPDLGYFKLKMDSGQQQEITVTLSNPTTEAVTVNVSLNGAKTNQNGVIEYGESDIEDDASLKFPFTDVVTGPKSVELAAGETKELNLTIQMPETRIDGVIAGGIELMRAGQGEEAVDEGGSKIINQYAYVIGVLLQESTELPTADLKLNSVSAGQSNYRNAIFVDFSNVIAAYLNDMTTEVQITSKGNSTVLYERKQTAMRMAPNSFIKFPVSMNGERMAAGSYTAAILVTSGTKRWEWTEDFEITNEDADKFNERDVGLVQEKGLNWQLIALIVGGIIVVIGIVFGLLMVVRKRKENEQQAMKKMQKKRKATEKKMK